MNKGGGQFRRGFNPCSTKIFRHNSCSGAVFRANVLKGRNASGFRVMVDDGANLEISKKGVIVRLIKNKENPNIVVNLDNCFGIELVCNDRDQEYLVRFLPSLHYRFLWSFDNSERAKEVFNKITDIPGFAWNID